jgi:hypothetical protein
MNRTVTAIALSTSLFSALFAGSGNVSAHPVGDVTEPSCHGQRVSHGANHSPIQEGHQLTPVERRDAIEQMFGENITVGEWNQFIATCPAPPPQP